MPDTVQVQPVTLTGTVARVEPLQPAHADALAIAAADGELWKLWYTSVPRPEAMHANVVWRLAQQTAGTMQPFVIRRVVDGTVVGATTFCNIEAEHRRLEIGYTWLARSAQRTAVNTEVKLLMLTHAFETLGLNAVEFRTHWMNQQSRAAIERLGAKLDGVLRAHRVMPDGSLRDTCVYSIVASEWPMVRAHLRSRLEVVRGCG